MKLLTRLRYHPPQQPYPSQTVVAWLEDESKESSDDDNEHIGIGASMVQDVLGMEFLDSCRRIIPEIHGEFHPHGLAYDEFAEYIADPES